jgi:hypothetical protein
MVQDFFREALPDAKESVRNMAADLVMSTLSAVGQQFSSTPRSDEEIAAYSEALADMLCAYLAKLATETSISI